MYVCMYKPPVTRFPIRCTRDARVNRGQWLMFRGTVVVVVVVLVRTDEKERGRLGGTVIRNSWRYVTSVTTEREINNNGPTIYKSFFFSFDIPFEPDSIIEWEKKFVKSSCLSFGCRDNRRFLASFSAIIHRATMKNIFLRSFVPRVEISFTQPTIFLSLSLSRSDILMKSVGNSSVRDGITLMTENTGLGGKPRMEDI